MASRGRALAISALCLLVIVVLVLVPPQAAGERLVPAMFVFGDSTVDVGNNNHLPNCAVDCRANYPRYGVDYPSSQSPTGRFSNGYNLADQIARFLGFPESPPAFQSLPNERIIRQMNRGANFASGGSGLLDDTGAEKCHQVYSMTEQLEKFSCAVRAMGNGTGGLVSRSLVFISVGSNDLFEYADASPANRNDTEFLQRLVASYRNYLKELYRVGARKFSIVSPSLVGCCPAQRVVAQAKKDVDRFGCFATANALSRQLYAMVQPMLEALSLELPGMNYSLGDSVGMAKSVFNRTAVSPNMNLTVVDTACCGGTGSSAGREIRCDLSASLCRDRAKYFFWDGFHPTDAAAAVAAEALFSDPGFFVRPINVKELATLRP